MKSVKENKLLLLCNNQLPHQMNNNIMPFNEKLVVTIPADLELSDAEKSVLGKGLTFVPVERKINSTEPKPIVRRFTASSEVKAHFHGRGNDDTVPTPDDCFAKFNQKISTWTLPELTSTSIAVDGLLAR